MMIVPLVASLLGFINKHFYNNYSFSLKIFSIIIVFSYVLVSFIKVSVTMQYSLQLFCYTYLVTGKVSIGTF